MHTLPDLPFSVTALEPHIDAKTMTIHHTKHHQAYITNLNAALSGTDFETLSLDDLMTQLDKLPEAKQAAVRNNGGGHYNHSLFWQCLTNKSNQAPSAKLAQAISDTFGSYDAFREAFETAAKTRFGSGWAWLYLQDNKLTVGSTPNQDNPAMSGNIPLLGLDVWEHAYYLTYQNRRPDYIAAFFNCVNWDFVSDRYNQFIK